MKARKPNLWNIWQHFKKQERSGHMANIWAFNIVECFTFNDKLKLYEERG